MFGTAQAHPLHELLERSLDELSGGQLQRVAIAKCLGERADLYLLDEPSAYLDVEQRLRMAKIIREMMDLRGKACIVVDHDLLETVLGRKIDLVSRGGLKPRIDDDIRSEAVLL